MQGYRWVMIVSTVFISVAFAFPNFAFAHSTVSPSQTIPSKYETFSLSVPTEKDAPTLGVRLLIPASLDRVTPFVKPGWNIDIKKEGEKVTEIEWTGGAIPTGQKDVFQFTARTPKEGTTLIWKAYQTYEGGEIVAWDRDPKVANKDAEVKNPYSTTSVTADEVSQHEKKEKGILPEKNQSNNDQSFYLSLAALIISLIAFRTARKK